VSRLESQVQSVKDVDVSSVTTQEVYRMISMIYLTYLATALTTIWLALAQTQAPQDSPTNTSSELDFGPVNFGGYDNYVYRDNTSAVQIVISE
jgi:hypothetical protein